MGATGGDGLPLMEDLLGDGLPDDGVRGGGALGGVGLGEAGELELRTDRSLGPATASASMFPARPRTTVAESTTIDQTLSCDSNAANLPHLDTAVGHLLIHQVGHLETQLSDQVVVQVGGAGCGKVG